MNFEYFNFEVDFFFYFLLLIFFNDYIGRSMSEREVLFKTNTAQTNSSDVNMLFTAMVYQTNLCDCQKENI